jgi:hypothetical protein
MKDLDRFLQRFAGSLTLAAVLAGCGGGGSAEDPSFEFELKGLNSSFDKMNKLFKNSLFNY